MERVFEKIPFSSVRAWQIPFSHTSFHCGSDIIKVLRLFQMTVWGQLHLTTIITAFWKADSEQETVKHTGEILVVRNCVTFAICSLTWITTKTNRHTEGKCQAWQKNLDTSNKKKKEEHDSSCLFIPTRHDARFSHPSMAFEFFSCLEKSFSYRKQNHQPRTMYVFNWACAHYVMVSKFQ